MINNNEWCHAQVIQLNTYFGVVLLSFTLQIRLFIPVIFIQDSAEKRSAAPFVFSPGENSSWLSWTLLGPFMSLCVTQGAHIQKCWISLLTFLHLYQMEWHKTFKRFKIT